jgi:hypothetical protein
MSILLTPQGDDHPEAASKHLQDASALLAASRHDGTAYLSGYVVECSLKSVVQLETGAPLHGHNFSNLNVRAATVSAVAGARTARYFGSATAGLLTSPIAAWKPEMRYQAPAISQADAIAFHQVASQVFTETIAEMLKDGVL